MKWFVRGFITLFDLALLLVLVRALMPTPGVAQLSEVSDDQTDRWAPPAWHPAPESLWALTQLDHAAPFTGGPKVRAQAALVADLDQGEILWGQGIDQRRPIASLTKLMSTLTLASHDPDLSQSLCVTRDLWPSWRGAKSKFETGQCHEGWEYVGAALVASDNRGAMAMPALADQSFDAFVEDMHRVSFELNLDAPSWVDPAGLDDNNQSSARDILKLLVAGGGHPLLQHTSTAPEWRVDMKGGPRRLATTNRRLSTYETHIAKTGYTSTAGWCFATTITTDEGRNLAVVVLGAPTRNARFTDTDKLIAWASRPS